jgi:hypothetical protein
MPGEERQQVIAQLPLVVEHGYTPRNALTAART